MNLHGLPPAVVAAGLAALDEKDTAREHLDDPAFVSSMAAVMAAAIAELPREECRRVGHETEILSVGGGDPRWISCSRCLSTWTVAAIIDIDEPTPQLAIEAPPKAPARPAVEPATTSQKTKPPAKAGRALPSRPSPAPPPGPDKSDVPGSSATVPPVPTETRPSEPPADGAVAEEPGVLPTCGSCGGALESETFATEVAKAFKGAVLCRDCLLSCEVCGEIIEGNERHGALDQARLSFIRWRKRLCFACHAEAATPPEPVVAGGAP